MCFIQTWKRTKNYNAALPLHAIMLGWLHVLRPNRNNLFLKCNFIKQKEMLEVKQTDVSTNNSMQIKL